MRGLGTRWLAAAVALAASVASCGSDDAGSGTTTTEGTGTTLGAATSAVPTTTGATTAASVPEPDCPPLPAGGGAGVVTFDTATGELVWEVAVAATASVAASGDVVVTGDESAVRAFDVETGALRWCQTGGGAVVAAGEVIVLVRDGAPLIGLDPANGEERWTSSVTAPSIPPEMAQLALVGGELNVYLDATAVDPTRGELIAVDASSGLRRWAWKPSTCAPLGPTPTACAAGPWYPTEHGSVFIADTNANEVVALDPVTGTQKWERSSGDRRLSRLSADDAVVLVEEQDEADPSEPFTGLSGASVGLDAATGVERWNRPLASTGLGARVTGGQVIVLEQTGIPFEPPLSGPPPAVTTIVRALDPLTGAERWHHDLPDETPTAALGISGVVVLDAVGTVGVPGFVALDATSGDEVWRTTHETDQGNTFDAPQAAADGRRFVAVVRTVTHSD